MASTGQENNSNNNNVTGGNKKDKSRSFKVKLAENGDQFGRYNGDSPYQAANKALSEIIRNKIKNSESVDDEITFFLVESTKGSSKKVHQYNGQRIKLDNPVQYTVANGQTITKEFKNILRKVKKPTRRGARGGRRANTEATVTTTNE